MHVATAAVFRGDRMIRSMSARSFARRVVFPYFSNPVRVCCLIEVFA
jgi:hypothetical protein